MNLKTNLKSVNKIATITFVVMTALPAYSFDFSKPFSPFMRIESDAVNIQAAPFLQDQLHLSSTQGFSLLRRGATDLDGAVEKIVRENALSPLLNMRSTIYQTAFSLSGTLESKEYFFYVQGIPVCSYSLKAHLLAGNEAFVTGQVPSLDLTEPAPTADWPEATQSTIKALEALKAHSPFKHASIIKHEKCFNVHNGSLMPVWRIIIDADGLAFQAISDENEVAEIQPMYFDVQGTAHVYEHNVVKGDLMDLTFDLTSTDGTLTNDFFVTLVNKFPRAQEPTNVFNYSPGDSKFDEASLFAHVNAQYNYFTNLGYAWLGSKPLNLEVHAVVGGTVNNALYKPAESNSNGLPSIQVGDGDGALLQNLATDADAVSHELGHHIIYKSVKDISGESLILHEGMADFFVFARTGDDCLGDSICPAGSAACWVKGQCLRTANNTLTYQTGEWTTIKEAHKLGQLVSGFLWDLRKNSVVPADDLSKLVYKSIDYLGRKASLNDLVVALIASDRELFAKKYSAGILSTASQRGFTDIASQINIDGPLPTDTVPANVPAAGGGSSSSSSKSSGPFACGTLGGNLDQQNQLWQGVLTICLFLIPLFVRQRRLAPARKRRTKN